MAAVAPTPEVARPAARAVRDAAEACLAAAAFAVLCVLVLRAAPYLPEPDDYAYRASIVAMTDGHFFTLSGPQAHALAERLAPGVAIFDTLTYRGPLRSGYQPGEITFSLSALGSNLRYMPAHLIQAMPMLVLGLAVLAGIEFRVQPRPIRSVSSTPAHNRMRHDTYQVV